MKARYKCLRCGRTWDHDVCYHEPPKGKERKGHPPAFPASPGCYGKVVKEYVGDRVYFDKVVGSTLPSREVTDVEGN